MIKNLIFDFGNVVIKFIPDYMISKVTDDANIHAALKQAVYGPGRFEETDRGFITAERHKRMVCAELPTHMHAYAEKLIDTWYLNLPVWDGMEQLLTDAKKAGYKLFLLSNINIQFSENRHKVEILKMFDGIQLSADVKHVKPEPEIYVSLLSRYNLKAEECLFVDDRLINVQGGENMGINGYLFDGNTEKLRKFINTSDDMAYTL